MNKVKLREIVENVLWDNLDLDTETIDELVDTIVETCDDEGLFEEEYVTYSNDE